MIQKSSNWLGELAHCLLLSCLLLSCLLLSTFGNVVAYAIRWLWCDQ